jgi:hypothetical protein
MTSSEAEDLSWGFRSRLGLLIVLIISALAAAIWSSTREQGQGEPEDRRRLMVVTQDDSNVNYYAVLERGGFEIEVGRFAEFEAEARTQLPDSEASGAALLLELADVRGFGFVVFEQPASLDLSALELDPAIDSIDDLPGRDYVVLSVGDLAFPHRLSVDAIGDDPVLRMPGYGALEAMFEQPAISVREVEDRPTVEELQYEDAIEVARWMHERPATFATAIEFARNNLALALALDADARTLADWLHAPRADSGPRASTFETGSAVPTPDGGVLVIHHALEVISEDAQNLELRAAATMRIDYLAPAALAGDLAGATLELQACPSLAGGELVVAEQPRVEAALDGSTVAIATPDGRATIWRKRGGVGCEWIELSTLPMLDDELSVLAPTLAPEQHTIMATVVHDEDGALVRLWLAPEQPGAAPGQVDDRLTEVDPGLTDKAVALELLRVPNGKIGALAFVDDVHVAVLTRVPLPEEEQTTRVRADHALELLDRRRPGAHLRIPTEFFAESRALRELVLLAAGEPGKTGPSFALTTADGVDTQLITLTIRDGAWQNFEQALLAVPPAGEPAPELFTLTPDDLEVRELVRAPAIAALGYSPRAGLLGYAPADGGPAEIAVIGLDGAPARQLTHNTLVDTLPRLTADGRHVVFVTGVRSSLADTAFSIPRVTSVTAAP